MASMEVVDLNPDEIKTSALKIHCVSNRR